MSITEATILITMYQSAPMEGEHKLCNYVRCFSTVGAIKNQIKIALNLQR